MKNSNDIELRLSNCSFELYSSFLAFHLFIYLSFPFFLLSYPFPNESIRIDRIYRRIPIYPISDRMSDEYFSKRMKAIHPSLVASNPFRLTPPHPATLRTFSLATPTPSSLFYMSLSVCLSVCLSHTFFVFLILITLFVLQFRSSSSLYAK